MPILQNPRREIFAQLFAQGKPAAAAYREAGYRPNKSYACRLRDMEEVAERIAELQQDAADIASVTLNGLLLDASRLQKKADARHQYSAAVAALTLKAKLGGFLVDRSENSHVVYAVSDKPLTMEEFDAKYLNGGPVIDVKEIPFIKN